MKYLKMFIFFGSVALISLSFQGCGGSDYIKWNTLDPVDPVDPIINPIDPVDPIIDPTYPIEEIVGQAIAIIYHMPQEYCSYSSIVNSIKSNLPEAGNFGLVGYLNTDPSFYSYNPDCGTETVSETGGCMTYNLANEDPIYSEVLFNCVINFDLAATNAQWADEVILAVNDLTVNAQ